jgi:hypothetical protein
MIVVVCGRSLIFDHCVVSMDCVLSVCLAQLVAVHRLHVARPAGSKERDPVLAMELFQPACEKGKRMLRL